MQNTTTKVVLRLSCSIINRDFSLQNHSRTVLEWFCSEKALFIIESHSLKTTFVVVICTCQLPGFLKAGHIKKNFLHIALLKLPDPGK